MGMKAEDALGASRAFTKKVAENIEHYCLNKYRNE